MEDIDYTNMPESDVVVNHILKRLQRGLYSLVLVTGLPGSGKSSTCLRLKELLYGKLKKKIDLTKKITIDSLLDLIEALLNSSPGDVFVIEELSVLFPSRRAMSTDNVSIARVLDTCRKKKIILISNAPLLKSIDGHIRALANIMIETKRVKAAKGVVISKCFRLQTDVRTSNTYLHRFNRKGKEIHLSFTRKPTSELWDLYEGEKDSFLTKLYSKLKYDQEKKGIKLDREMGIKPKPVKPLTMKELKIYDLYFNKEMTQTSIAQVMGVSIPTICIKLKKIKEKAQFLKEIKGFSSNTPLLLANK